MNIFNTILIEPLANGLILFYRVLGGNLGLAIIAFTLVLRLVLNPLTKPYMQSMKKIRNLAPEIEKLKKKHKGDKMKIAQAQADLYKEKKVNPGAGCLPYLLQIVVLIAFFNVFTHTLATDNPTEGFNKLLYQPLKFAEGQTLNPKFLYFDLTKPDVFNIPGLPFGIPGVLLIVGAVFQFLSAKSMSPLVKAESAVAKKTKEKEDDMQASMQKSMIYIFPLFTLVIGMNFVAGLALYWLIFSGLQAYQQMKLQKAE